MPSRIVTWIKRLAEIGQIADVGFIVALMVAIAVCAFAFYQVTGAIPTEPGSYTDNAVNNVEEKGLTVFNLLTILAIVAVAATIIATVVRAIGGYGARRPAPETPPAEISP